MQRVRAAEPLVDPRRAGHRGGGQRGGDVRLAHTRGYDELQTPPWALPYTLPHSGALATGVVATAPDRPGPA